MSGASPPAVSRTGRSRDAGEIEGHGLAVARGRIEARLDRLLDARFTNPENRKLAKHVSNHRDQMFTFLERSGIHATNWRAEQELRPAVVTRKMSAGNRSPDGAHAQEVLMSVLRTCARQGRDPVDFLARVQRAATVQALPRFRWSVPGVPRIKPP